MRIWQLPSPPDEKGAERNGAARLAQPSRQGASHAFGLDVRLFCKDERYSGHRRYFYNVTVNPFHRFHA